MKPYETDSNNKFKISDYNNTGTTNMIIIDSIILSEPIDIHNYGAHNHMKPFLSQIQIEAAETNLLDFTYKYCLLLFKDYYCNN